MQLIRTARFRRAYRKLDTRYRELIQKALAQFLADKGVVKNLPDTDTLLESKFVKGVKK